MKNFLEIPSVHQRIRWINEVLAPEEEDETKLYANKIKKLRYLMDLKGETQDKGTNESHMINNQQPEITTDPNHTKQTESKTNRPRINGAYQWCSH